MDFSPYDVKWDLTILKGLNGISHIATNRAWLGVRDTNINLIQSEMNRRVFRHTIPLLNICYPCISHICVEFPNLSGCSTTSKLETKAMKTKRFPRVKHLLWHYTQVRPSHYSSRENITSEMRLFKGGDPRMFIAVRIKNFISSQAISARRKLEHTRGPTRHPRDMPGGY